MNHKFFLCTGVAVFLLLLLHSPASAQGIRRSAICSTGGSAATPAGIRLRSTTAQPPNAGTVSSSTNRLRQGFQQPATCAAAPSARFEAFTDDPPECGGLYRFNYTGQPRPNTEFFWTFGLGAQPPASYSGAPDAVNYLAPGIKIVILEVLTDECRSTDTLFLDVQAIPLAVVPNITNLWCREEEDGGVSLFIAGGTEPYNISWTGGQSGADIGGLSPGTYAYTVTDANGCLNGGAATVGSPDSLFTATLVRDESCRGSNDGRIETAVSGGTAPYRFQWSDGSSNATAAGLAKGSYSVTITDENDCRQYLAFDVGRRCDGLTFYDVFSPNGDGLNDFWAIDGIDLFPSNRLFVYDRWGLLVYSSQGYANTWDGRHNDGVPLPFGAYFYILHLGDPADTLLKGSVTIIR